MTRHTPRSTFFPHTTLFGSVGGLGGPTAAATITVIALHVPTVTGATTLENTQTTSGLVITPNTADTSVVTNFQITDITGGLLVHKDDVKASNYIDFSTAVQE